MYVHVHGMYTYMPTVFLAWFAQQRCEHAKVIGFKGFGYCFVWHKTQMSTDLHVKLRPTQFQDNDCRKLGHRSNITCCGDVVFLRNESNSFPRLISIHLFWWQWCHHGGRVSSSIDGAELPFLPDSAERSLKINNFVHVLMIKFESSQILKLISVEVSWPSG